MKTKNLIAMAMAGLLALPAFSEEETAPQPGDILQDINMFNPEDGDPAYKVKANDKHGTQWAVDVAYGYWSTNNALPGTSGKNNFALLHAQLNQRIIQDDVNGGTWLRAEVSGSWALDATTRKAERNDMGFVSGMGSGTDAHADLYGSNGFYLPELALMHYFNGKKACIIAGMVNLTNYFDAVGIANDSFSSFTNTGFVNSTILPLVDSNVGGIVQVELNRKNYVMAAVSRTDCEMGYDPFNTHGSGYCIVGEYGHIFGDGKAVLRINPFFQSVETDCVDENGESGTKSRKTAGLVASIEYTPVDRVTVFARAGFAAKQALGSTAEFSCGANVQLLPRREDDFFGIAWGVFKHQNSDEDDNATCHNREQVLEVMYSCQITDWFKIVPHYQYIHNPAYRSDTRDASVFGVQTVFSF